MSPLRGRRFSAVTGQLLPPGDRPVKALVGAASAVVGVLASAATDGHITLAEYLVAAGAGLAAFSGVYGADNRPRT